MTCFVGATGLDIVDDAIANAIEEATATLTTLIITQDNLQAGYSSNYTELQVKYGSNYTDLQAVYSSNYTLRLNNHNSNYVLSTSNILAGRIRQLEDRVDDLEGTDGDPGDPDADPPIPPIPPTGNYAILATLGVLTAGAAATAIVLADLSDDVNDLEDKVDLNAIYGSNYVMTTSNILVRRVLEEVGHGSNYLRRMDTNVSNYVLTSSNFLVNRVLEEVGHGSNYLRRMDTNVSNYVLTSSNLLVNRVLEEVGHGSNYLRRMDTNVSNYVLATSNNLVRRVLEEVGHGSNYLRRMDTNVSNYILTSSNNLVNRVLEEVGHGSNYLRRMDTNVSNYVLTSSNNLVGRVLEEVGHGSNYLRRMDTNVSNYVLTSSNNLVGRVLEEVGHGSNYLRRMDTNVSNYILTSSNLLVNRIMREVGFGSNYTERLIATLPTPTNYWTEQNTNNIYLNKTGNVGIGTITPQTKLHIYNATASTIRLETGTSGKPSIEFSVGTLTDTITDYRMINDAYELKFQFQDNLVSYGGAGSDIMVINDKGTTYTKPAYYESGLGVKTSPDPLYSLDVSGNCRYLSGNVGVGIEPLSPYRLNVGGDVNIEGIGKRYFVNNTPIVSSQWATSGTTIEYNTGSVGIGTSPFSYKLNVNGSINATSVLVGGNPISGSKWTTATDTTRIYYNTGFVGIGTTNPQTKLHIRDDTTNTTALTIQNNFTGGGLPTEIVVSGTTRTTIGTTDRCIMFPYSGTGATKDYSFTTTENLICDILIVGGGGGGGDPHGGGGGAGQLVLIYQATLLNGTYNVKVGKGGTGGIYQSTSATKGSNSEFGNSTANVIAEGGGANSNTSSDKNGGSGAGGDGYTPGGGTSGAGNAITTTDLFPTATVYTRGNNGGNEGGFERAGGGGGAGEIGQSGSISGKGGDGLSEITAINYDFQTNFGNYGRLEADSKYYFAGGGGGGNTLSVNSSKGGGGAGGSNTNNLGGNGVANTGSGGGGGGGGGSAVGGTGGSGIVIIKYRILPTQSSTIELIRGTTTDANHDWKLGNYNGEFKVISSLSGVDTDRLVVSSAGNVEIGTRQWPNIPGTNIFRANGNALVNSVLRFGLGYYGSFGTFPCNKLNFYPLVGYGNGIGLGSASIQYFCGNPFNNFGNHIFYTGSSDTSLGTERMSVSETGVSIPNIVNIGAINNYDGGSITKLRVYASDNNDCSAIFKHPNDTQGIGISYDGLRALGSAANQNIVMNPRGSGIFVVFGTGGSGNTNYRYFSLGGVSGVESGAFSSIGALFVGAVWTQQYFITSSDSRIKEDIQDINDDDALNKILLIEPKTYKYIDKVSRGDKRVYGFIAQQVGEVVPEAIKLSKSYIPNIMILADYDNKVITLPSQPTKVIIKVNDNIKCYDDDNNEVLCKVDEVIDDLTFKVKAIDDMKTLEYTGNKLFVYGTEVDDFNTLNKDYIFTLNVCATQELHRRITSQDERIKELEDKVERLLNYISV